MGRTGVGSGRSLPAERHSSAKSFADAGCPKHCTKQRVRKLLAARRDRIPAVCAAHAGLNLAWRGIRMRSVAPSPQFAAWRRPGSKAPLCSQSSSMCPKPPARLQGCCRRPRNRGARRDRARSSGWPSVNHPFTKTFPVRWSSLVQELYPPARPSSGSRPRRFPKFEPGCPRGVVFTKPGLLRQGMRAQVSHRP
jgi:hypothetical protein